MSIDKEIVEAIKKHLPEQVGETLKGELNRLKQLERENASLEQDNKKLGAKVTDLVKQVAELEAMKERWDGLQQKEARLSDEARCQWVRSEVLAVKEEAARREVEIVKDCFRLVFGNRAVRETVQKSVPVEGTVYDNYQGKYVQGTQFKDVTETKTTEDV